MDRPERAREPDFDEVAEAEIDAEAGELELPGPKPMTDQDPDGFRITSAGQDGPLPPDVQRELTQLAEAIETAVEDPEGMVATRFGRRVVVAPVDDPSQAVDVADVDMTRNLVLTFGAEDPTPEGSLLAQVLLQRRQLAHGYVHAPDADGPNFSTMKRVLPSLRAAGAVEVEDVGTLAVGHGPAEIAGALEGLLERQEEEAANADDEDAVDGDPDVNRV